MLKRRKLEAIKERIGITRESETLINSKPEKNNACAIYDDQHNEGENFYKNIEESCESESDENLSMEDDQDDEMEDQV